MFGVRFHGRGGHGVKTASRILGTTAFLCGYHCQDCPVYGAERRGAAVTAYTRFGRRPILERGVIAHPSLLVVADETLLQDPTAAVLQGVRPQTRIFVNGSPDSHLASCEGLECPIQRLDLTDAARHHLGRASSLSAGLAAAAVRLSGQLSLNAMADALAQELQALGLNDAALKRNIEFATWVYEQLPQYPPLERLGPPEPAGSLEDVGPLENGVSDRHAPNDSPARNDPVVDVPAITKETAAPTVLHVANATARPTGAWRIERPVIDPTLCTRCGLCLAACPDGTISRDATGLPQIDYEHCKGCMICEQRCPVRAIHGEQETRAW